MSRRLFGGAALVVLLALVGISSQFTSLQARPDEKPLFTRLIGPQTLLFEHARVADLLSMPIIDELAKQFPDMKENLFKGFEKELGFALADLEAFTMYFDQPKFAGGGLEEPRPPYFLLQAKKPLDAAAVKSSVGEGAKTIQFGKYSLTMGRQRGVCLLDDRNLLIVMFSPAFSMDNAQKDLLLHFAGLESGTEVPVGLRAGVEAAQKNKSLSVTGFQIPKELGDLMQEQMKSLPPMMAMLKPLGQLQSGVLTLDYVKGAENDLQLKLLGRFPDEGAAKAAANALRFALAAGKMAMTSMPNRNDPEMKAVYDFTTKQLEQIKFDASNKDVVVDYQMNIGKTMPIITAAVEKVRFAANYMLSSSNMRQCIIAMHNYHNDYGKMPEAMTMKDGKPMHSWRVMMLPYLEQDQLFKQINMNEPWDSEANKKLFESVEMPKIYAHPGKNDGNTKMTYYKVFYSKPGVTPRAGFSLGKPITLGQMTVKDGTSNTIAMVEAGPPVLWYKPDDIEFDPKAQLPNMTSPWKDKKVNIAFFDGSVRTGWLGADDETWKGLITIDGGEVVDFSKIEQKK
jgi:prepilin-type processing-associated H-X9-DG protein